MARRAPAPGGWLRFCFTVAAAAAAAASPVASESGLFGALRNKRLSPSRCLVVRVAACARPACRGREENQRHQHSVFARLTGSATPSPRPQYETFSTTRQHHTFQFFPLLSSCRVPPHKTKERERLSRARARTASSCATKDSESMALCQLTTLQSSNSCTQCSSGSRGAASGCLFAAERD
ncbi:uncharacterized protein IWZ02DRAFT_140491 [Phyllosticta citriasiana]|uniref:uncharacterized protein n=1 Tax=Phyllosticta citriasiana TaxID=595635 RepID=UPI0030FD5B0E